VQPLHRVRSCVEALHCTCRGLFHPLVPSDPPLLNMFTVAATTAKEICAALIIGIILIQVPQVRHPAVTHAP
jgi:hypothetical protein